MSRQKLKRFEELKQRNNVIQYDQNIAKDIKGNWNHRIFKNDNPINLELACGRGEYSVGLAKELPHENFIGVDIKGERLWQGSTKAMELELENVAFVRNFILDIENLFEVGEINNIWIIHPDPRPRTRDEKRRLTHHRFLDIYKNIQGSKGKVCLKTDNSDLFDWTLEEILANRSDISDLHFTQDLHNSVYLDEHYGITTRYERKFSKKGAKIKYLRFEWKA